MTTNGPRITPTIAMSSSLLRPATTGSAGTLTGSVATTRAGVGAGAGIGASAGIVTDTHARVLAGDGAPVEGLYAIGNDMASVMGGTYPGPGITIGPALTFAYVALAWWLRGACVAADMAQAGCKTTGRI